MAVYLFSINDLTKVSYLYLEHLVLIAYLRYEIKKLIRGGNFRQYSETPKFPNKLEN